MICHDHDPDGNRDTYPSAPLQAIHMSLLLHQYMPTQRFRDTQCKLAFFGDRKMLAYKKKSGDFSRTND